LKSFLFTPEGSLILPAQILEAYALAYADGYTLNFRFAAGFTFWTEFSHYFFLAVFFALAKSDAFGAPLAPFFRILPPRFLLAWMFA
jgi:hypothetical protein